MSNNLDSVEVSDTFISAINDYYLPRLCSPENEAKLSEKQRTDLSGLLNRIKFHFEDIKTLTGQIQEVLNHEELEI